MDLFQGAPPLERRCRLGLEQRRKLEGVFVDGARRAPIRIGRLCDFRA